MIGPPLISSEWTTRFRGNGPTRFRPSGTTGRSRFSILSDGFLDPSPGSPGAQRRLSASNDRFLRMAAVGVRPDRRSSAVCGGSFLVMTSQRRTSARLPRNQYRRGTSRTGESWMARRTLTVDRHVEIKRRLADGRGVREIAAALNCSRRLVRQIRDGERQTHETAARPDPLWMSQLEWPVIIHELGLGFAMKDIWEERAKALITYPNFWKQFLPQVPAVPRGDDHRARVRARRTR